MSRTTVADVIVDGLERAGTPRVFLAGAAEPSRALGDAARRLSLPAVGVSGAAVACLMAAVTGQLANAPGAAVVSLGPDAVGEAGSALTARAPLILLTDDDAAPDPLERPGPAVKRCARIESSAAGEAFARALVLAMTEPCGPVHVRVAAEVLAGEASRITGACRPGPPPAPDPGGLDAAAGLLGRAARPVLVAGRGSRQSEVGKWLRALAEALPAPVLVTRAAKGAIPDPHPLALGVVGTAVATALARQSDLLVAIGADGDEVARSWWPEAPAMLLGYGRAAVEPVHWAVEVAGEIAAILEELAPRLRTRERADWDVAALDRLKRQLAAPLAPGSAFGPARIVELAREATTAGTIATVDAGRYHEAALERWRAVGPLQLLAAPDGARGGFALPAALAAALCHPDRPVLCLADAAAIVREPGELALAARLALPVAIVAGGSATDDAVALARALAIPAVTAEGPDAFRGALGRALAGLRPALIAVPGASGPV